MNQYNPFFGGAMQSFQPGQQQVDPKYMNDPLIQKLMQDQVKSQIINAFAPQQGMGGFLEQLLTSVPAPSTAPSTTPTSANPYDQAKNPKKWARWNSTQGMSATPLRWDGSIAQPQQPRPSFGNQWI